MSGPVDPLRVHSFVLFLPSGAEPPTLPWADEFSEDNPKLPRWIRLDGECHGDGKTMPRELYGLVCDAKRNPDEIIFGFHRLALEQSCDEAMLVVHRAFHDDLEQYVKQGAPLLLAAARSPAKHATPLLPALTSEAALRELVDRTVVPTGRAFAPTRGTKK